MTLEELVEVLLGERAVPVAHFFAQREHLQSLGLGALGAEAHQLAPRGRVAVIDDRDHAEGFRLRALAVGGRALLLEAVEDVLDDAVERVFEKVVLVEALGE